MHSKNLQYSSTGKIKDSDLFDLVNMSGTTCTVEPAASVIALLCKVYHEKDVCLGRWLCTQAICQEQAQGEGCGWTWRVWWGPVALNTCPLAHWPLKEAR